MVPLVERVQVHVVNGPVQSRFIIIHPDEQNTVEEHEHNPVPILDAFAREIAHRVNRLVPPLDSHVDQLQNADPPHFLSDPPNPEIIHEPETEEKDGKEDEIISIYSEQIDVGRAAEIEVVVH